MYLSLGLAGIILAVSIVIYSFIGGVADCKSLFHSAMGRHVESEKDRPENDSEVGVHAVHGDKGVDRLMVPVNSNAKDAVQTTSHAADASTTSYFGYVSGSVRGLYRGISGKIYDML